MPTTSKGRGSPPCSCGRSSRRASARSFSSERLRCARLPSSANSCVYQLRMSASVCSVSTRTVPLFEADLSSSCTWRSVTGSMASALCSMTPNGAAANLAIGGALPVFTASGNIEALASGRPALSFRLAGNSICSVAFSGSGRAKVTDCTSSPGSARFSNTGAAPATAVPAGACRALAAAAGAAVPGNSRRRILSASPREMGAENRSVIASTGQHGAPARSRSQLNSAVKGLRTWKRKRCSTRVTMPGLAAAAMPLPQTKRIAASKGRGREQVSTSTRSGWRLRRRAFSNSSRAGPVMMRTGRRSPMPSTSHQLFASTLLCTAAPLSCSRKCWSSSMTLRSQGCIVVTAGPPVLKLNSVRPVSGAFSGAHSARSLSEQRMPGARLSLKS